MWKDIWRHAARTGQAAAFALGLLASPALAYQITVGTATYDITGFVTTSYDANPGLVTSQPWWGNPTLAQDIVDALVLDGFNEGTEFGVTPLLFAHTLAGDVFMEQMFLGLDLGTNDSGTSVVLAFATGTIVGPAAVPEIDGNALAKALFILFALGAWLDARRRRAQGVSPRIVLAD